MFDKQFDVAILFQKNTLNGNLRTECFVECLKSLRRHPVRTYHIFINDSTDIDDLVSWMEGFLPNVKIYYRDFKRMDVRNYRKKGGVFADFHHFAVLRNWVFETLKAQASPITTLSIDSDIVLDTFPLELLDFNCPIQFAVDNSNGRKNVWNCWKVTDERWESGGRVYKKKNDWFDDKIEEEMEELVNHYFEGDLDLYLYPLEINICSNVGACTLFPSSIYTNFSYSFHHQGEDLSLSDDLIDAGIPVLLYQKWRTLHLMSPEMLQMYKQTKGVQ